MNQSVLGTDLRPLKWTDPILSSLFMTSPSQTSPVSPTCVPCKMLEHIVCSNVMAHLDEHQPLSDRQHSFRKRHSCETQLTTVIIDWIKILNKEGQVDTFILDFENTFDTQPHELLKSKIFCYGIGGKTLKWTDSFLCYRKQRAVVKGEILGCAPAGTDKSNIFPLVHWVGKRVFHLLSGKLACPAFCSDIT